METLVPVELPLLKQKVHHLSGGGLWLGTRAGRQELWSARGAGGSREGAGRGWPWLTWDASSSNSSRRGGRCGQLGGMPLGCRPPHLAGAAQLGQRGCLCGPTHAPLGAAECPSSRARAGTSRSGETPLGSAVASWVSCSPKTIPLSLWVLLVMWELEQKWLLFASRSNPAPWTLHCLPCAEQGSHSLQLSVWQF